MKTVGVHPRLAGECVPWTKLEQLMLRSECAAIGECGLDETAVNREDPDAGMEEQEALLKKHLDVAKRSRKPLVFHVRGRTDETTQKLFGKLLSILQASGLDKKHKIYLHCFTGTLKEMRAWRTAFPRVLLGITWHSTQTAAFAEVGRVTPLEHLALETDAPHLSPVRGRDNRPEWIVHQAQRLASRRNIPVEVVLRRCSLQSIRFYCDN